VEENNEIKRNGAEERGKEKTGRREDLFANT
jgi:hypothetical protein